MDRTKKWRKILAMMLTIVMMLQNVQSVVWATGTDSSTQETTVEKKSDSEDDKTAKDEEQTKEEISDKSSEELTDSEEKNTEETAAVLTSKASQSVTADTVGDVISYYANYRLDVTNTGNAAAEGVKVEITLPVKDVAVDTSKTYTTGYTENVNENDESVLTWENQGVATGETGTYMFSIHSVSFICQYLRCLIIRDSVGIVGRITVSIIISAIAVVSVLIVITCIISRIIIGILSGIVAVCIASGTVICFYICSQCLVASCYPFFGFSL